MKGDDGAVRVSVTVEAPPERAFQIFSEQCDAWWPRAHRLGEGVANEEGWPGILPAYAGLVAREGAS